MVTTSMAIRGQGEFFSNDRLLKRVKDFQDEVEEDPNKYQAGVLIALAAEFTTYGISEFDRLAKALNQKNFGDSNIPPIFVALLERYKGLWTQQIQTGFATARSSIEGKTMFGQPSQLVRLIRALRGLFSKEEKVVAQNTTLKGVVRARTNAAGERVKHSVNLAAYLRMLTRTIPMNFRRDYEQLFVRLETRAKLPADELPGPKNEQLYLINTGHSEASCTTCLMCNGRVLTRSALDFATTMLSPPLFHPNCRHAVLPSLKATEKSYDEVEGEIVTVATINGWIRAGKVKRASNPSPRTVNV